MDGPSFPAPPDPVATANAQGQINADTARLTQRMNLVDQVGPGYTIRYNRIGPDGTGTGVGVGGAPGTSASPYYGTLADGTPVDRAHFNAQAYLDANPDVASAINAPGSWLTGDRDAAAWQHFTQYGASEGRSWNGGPTGSTQAASPRLNWDINWASPLNNGVIDPYQGLDRQRYDAIRRAAGFNRPEDKFAYEGGAPNAFENWLRASDYGTQVTYINALEQAGADPDYIRGLIQQLPAAPGLTNPYAADNTDRWQQTIQLDPTQRALYDQTQALNNTLLSLAQGQAGRVGSALSQPLDATGLPSLVGNLDLSGLPELTGNIFGIGTVGGNQALSNGTIDPYAGLSGGKESFDALRRGLGYDGAFGGGAFENWLSGQNQGVKDRYIAELRAANADPDYLRQLGATADPFATLSALRSQSETALFDRLNPQLQRDRTGLEDRLRNQGVMPGSQAWQTAMDDLNRGQNDARLAVTAQGGDELSRQFAMALQNATFGNQARSQALNELLANANLSNAARGQGLQERAYLQNTPINQISSLRAGTQVSLPQAWQPPQVGVQAPNYQDAVYSGYQGQVEQAKAQQQAQSAMFGNIFGMLGNGVGKFW